MSDSKKKIGFIGLGIMGKPMCRNVKKAGYEVVVFNRSKESVRELAAEGAIAAASVAEVASQCKVIITMLPNSPEVREVCLENGIADHAKAGTMVIDMSSIDPVQTKEIGAELAKYGVEMMDAPVSGGEPGAIAGTLSVMVGGTKENFDWYYDLLMTMASSVVYVEMCIRDRPQGHHKAHRFSQGKHRPERYGHEVSASLSGRNLRAYQ